MAIARVGGQALGATADNTTAVSKAFASNVTAGSLIVVSAGKFSPGTDAFSAGDCTKSAGTATLGAISLDSSNNFQFGGSSEWIAMGVWSAIVTGSGSCTMQVGGALAGSYLLIGINEYTGSWDASRVEDFAANGSGTGAASTGVSDSAGAALFFGGATTATTASTTHTVDANWTNVFEEENGAVHATGLIADWIVGGATSDDFNLTAPTTDPWSAAMAVYKEAAGGGGGTSILRQMLMSH